jgi:hypothetical protein
MNSLGKGWNPLQSHSDFAPKKPVLSPRGAFPSNDWSEELRQVKVAIPQIDWLLADSRATDWTLERPSVVTQW